MSLVYCSRCGTARQRNIVVVDGGYICLECLFFPGGIDKKCPGRYMGRVIREVKSSLGLIRRELPVCADKNRDGYYVLGSPEMSYLRERVVNHISELASRHLSCKGCGA